LRFYRWGSTPTTDAIERTVAHRNYHLHLAAPWQSVRMQDGQVVVQAASKEFRCDFVILGTGYGVDLSLRPELADFHREVLLWRDRYTPPPGDEDEFLGAHPYLGGGHEYLEMAPGAAPYLRDIHVQNPAGFVSFGLPIGDIPSMKRDIPTIVARISRDLFLADLAHHEQRMTADVTPDFGPEAYASAVRQ
jgi:hypothetical protein